MASCMKALVGTSAIVISLWAVVGCGGESRHDFEADAGESSGAAAGKGGSGGTGGGSGGTGTGGAAAGSGTGGTPMGGAGGSGGAAAGGSSGLGGGTAGLSGGGTAGDTSAGSGGGSGESGGIGGGAGAGSSGGMGDIVCSGTSEFAFPEFDRSCSTAEDCVAVEHTTNCCGGGLIYAINADERQAFDAAESTCDSQYPPCGCAAQDLDVEDGTQVSFQWDAQIGVTCDDGSCRAHNTSATFECGTRLCTETQYCHVMFGGPADSEPSYSCFETTCSDCSCLNAIGCTCSEESGHLLVECYAP
jgi:hypothetical protein